MKQDFNFDQPNKRLPYTVPEGFFSDLESRILAATVGAAGRSDADTEIGHARATGSDGEPATRPTAPLTAQSTDPSADQSVARTADQPATQPVAPFSDQSATQIADRPATQTANRPAKRARTLRRWLVAATAAAALTVVALLPHRSGTQPVTLADVEQTFAQLSDEDQAELLAIYQDDPFIYL